MRAELEVTDVAADIEADEAETMAEVNTEIQPMVKTPFIEEADGLSQTTVDAQL